MMPMGETILKTKTLIKRLRQSDDKTKKIYVYGISTVLMMAVIGLWFLYLNITLPQANPIVTTSTTPMTAMGGGNTETAPSPSIWSTFSRGLHLVWGDLHRAVGSITNTFSRSWEAFQKQIQKTNTIQLEATSTGGQQ